MERIGRRVAAILAAAGALVLLATPAWASTPATGSGTFADTGFLGPPSIRTAGGNTFVMVTLSGVFEGTMTGTRTLTAHLVFHADGTLNGHGEETCMCTVGGRTGTFVDRFEVNGAGQTFTTHLTVISGTGELSNLHAVATVSGSVNPATSLGSGTYSIQYHFDP